MSMPLQAAAAEAEHDDHNDHDRAGHEDRLARARAALGAAERSAARWGGRIDRTALRGRSLHSGASGPDPGSVPESTSDPGRETTTELEDGLGTRLPVPGPLSALFPRSSLRAGSSVAIEGAASTSVLLSLAVAAAGEDSWCAVAGMPDLGLRSALDAGLDPCRLALAPTHGEQRPQVLSALADGVGVLVLGPDLDLTPALWRSLLSRARTADTLVLAAAPPGRADIALRSTTHAWTGLGAGSGRLRRRRLAVTSTGRGIAGHREVEVLLPQASGLIAQAPQGRSVPAETAAPTGIRLLDPVPRAG
ncbi:MAG: hypothetical protein L0G94_00345 [Brachybacterium sp.]|uniref:hypothetical protein n=1 Tax=Brachybacterium sp. TaxID=1891286 RepID=UPI002647D79B|nr:hypothetical protein [Brachybacterium sp.]MDN5685121.1 hypothetical protein [Brachybacterium sp.]